MKSDVTSIKILCVMGTRPEAIKLCPVIRHIRSVASASVIDVCVTGQHRFIIDQVLATFRIRPEYDLNLMRPGQTLFQSTARIIAGLEHVMRASRPDLVLVQGDTTTTFCAALAGTYAGATIGHLEAGLRTGDKQQPFPEEINRVLITKMATWHFAPTTSAERNLIAEGVPPSQVMVTGNSGVDAALTVRDELRKGRLRPQLRLPLDPTRKLILVTVHRRENFGKALDEICRALVRLAQRNDVQIVYPVHPNPSVSEPVTQYLDSLPNVILLKPVDYVSFIDLICKAYLVLTDSGGVQEEGPCLGKPVLVMRRKTERLEAIQAGTVRVVGTDEETVYHQACMVLDNPALHAAMSRAENHYGDGHASSRIWNFINSRVFSK